MRLACKRFLNDLMRSKLEPDYPYEWDQSKAKEHLDFYPLFTQHVKGKLAGEPIEVEPWQGFIVGNLFGWVHRETRLRRYRIAYNEVARKNSKSTLSSGIGLYMTALDGEGGAEVYSAATTRDQARIVFNDAQQMVKKSKALSKVFGVHQRNIHHLASGSKFEPLSADANTLDGLNVHCGIIDELHAHQKRDVYDVIETATGAREQPLIFVITTAGFNKLGVCYELREYAMKVLRGVVDDDSFFAAIFTLDEDDDWRDESVWMKANPNLGKSKKWDDMRRLAKKAKEMPTARNNFLTKHLNIWVNAASAWMNAEKWAELPEFKVTHSSWPCWIGLDLSSKLDITALIALFRNGENYAFKCKFFLPEETIITKTQTIANLYQTWCDLGFLELTEGNVIDHEAVKESIREWGASYNVQAVCFDPWNATQLATELLAEGVPMVEVHQSVKNLSEAMKECEALTYSGRIAKEVNQCMDWMISNVTCVEDRNGNVFPRKEHRDNKIDGPVALFTALSRALLNDVAYNPYEDDDYEVLIL
ncbi:terminase large subunit [Pleionea sp. CnH1-48]|uniref:terminase large subunit n=1 Tax=Pleionea sp. CnH1-48 TaxID=2954494 RepID=UPI0020980C85|nr:terminase TerL endonuclease subunit [Pleionea sp. CnH1-48]MCO7225766.1 terminase large subunit [Pleionea sp. CnH1-48]